MYLYAAGACGSAHKREISWQKACPRRLVSFHYMQGTMIALEVAAQRQGRKMSNVDIFLDSGAYSAWVQNVHIDIDDYIEFVKQQQDNLHLYAVLDVIGDAEGTLRNQRKMEKAGLSPLPCFHFGEPMKYLRQYVKEYDYVAIGGLAAMGVGSQMIDFLDAVFDIVCDKDGMPKVKTHGFAVTSLRAMKRYPWYSVDSTTWILNARMGIIVVPHRMPNGEWDYLEDMPGKITRRISVSTTSPSSSLPDQHFSTLSNQWQDEVLEWLDLHGMKMGKSKFKKVKPGYELEENERWVSAPGVGDFDGDTSFGIVHRKVSIKDKQYVEVVEEPGVCNGYVDRDIINGMYFMELAQHFPKWPYKWKRPNLRGFGF